MFDDLKPKTSQPVTAGGSEQTNKQGGGELNSSANSKPQVEDMFAETDKTVAVNSESPRIREEQSVKPPVFQPKEPAVGEEEPNIKAKRGGINKYIALSMAVLAVIAVLSGGWYAYSKFFASGNGLIPADDSGGAQEQEVNKTVKQEDGEEQNKEEEQEKKSAIKPAVKPADKDHDGLSDEEEAKFGTNANNVDSDGDGLFDREEVKVYKTDPLNSDTDGDGYSDGSEVKNGYNPNGAGKLYEIK